MREHEVSNRAEEKKKYISMNNMEGTETLPCSCIYGCKVKCILCENKSSLYCHILHKSRAAMVAAIFFHSRISKSRSNHFVIMG